MRVVSSGEFGEKGVCLAGHIAEQSPGGRSAESGRVRHIVKSTEGSAWNVPVTAVDAQVGDAGVSGRVWEGVLAPSS